MAPEESPKLYSRLAPWFHLLTAPEDDAEEAEIYRRLLTEACGAQPRTVLELGSGGGNNASHMKAHFQMTLTDVSPEMLALSRTINPELEHIQGDMRTLRLGREFDAVFVHDAVVYLTTEEDLAAAIQTAFAHCGPGGTALFVPDYIRETFRTSTDHGGHDGPDGRGCRYLEWTTDPDPDDTTYTVDYAFLLREADGSVRVEHDRHIEGVFLATHGCACCGTRASSPAPYTSSFLTMIPAPRKCSWRSGPRRDAHPVIGDVRRRANAVETPCWIASAGSPFVIGSSP